MIILGFDFGTKYIGLASGQSITKTSTPLGTIPAKNGTPDWTVIEQYITEWAPNCLIVGLPLNMDGSEQQISLCAKKFANRLKYRSKIPVHLVDERLSTWEAKQRIKKSSSRNNQQQYLNQVNAESAAILVEQWLRDHANL